MKLLVTGGCGFIGSHFVRMALEANPELSIVNLDALTYAGRRENLEDVEKKFGAASANGAGKPSPGGSRARYSFVHGNILDIPLVTRVCKEVDQVIHFAAESHVQRSILDAGTFAETDVLGTQRLLQASLDAGHKRFFYISTDEVYGSRPTGFFKEEDALDPSSPYSASKAGAELMVRAYERTHGLKFTITRTTNNYGTHQHPEKLIPLAITHYLQDKKVLLYGDGKAERDWIHVSDNVRALLLLLQKEKTGFYNIGQGTPTPNLDIVTEICKQMGKAPDQYIGFTTDRKGHDRRYAVNSDKMRALGWKPQVKWSDGIKDTVDWYVKNPKWWQGHTGNV